MKILITGATGLIGKRLTETLLQRGQDQLVVLTRNKGKANFPEQVDVVEWKNPASDLIPSEALAGVEAVIHLAGESIAEGRWTKAKKERLWSSRVDATRNLIKSFENSSNHNLKTVLSSSAIGFYGDRQDEALTEASEKGSGYLSDLCHNWELSSLSETLTNTRFVQLRTGIVLSKDGGALAKMLPPFKMGAGGRLGSGNQWMSWVHIDDMVGLILHSLENQAIQGVVNATAPEPVTNSGFTKVLGTVIKRPTIFPVPAFGLKVLFGEMSSILLEGQRVLPQKLQDHGYQFQYGKLHDALEAILVKKIELQTLSTNVG